MLITGVLFTATYSYSTLQRNEAPPKTSTASINQGQQDARMNWLRVMRYATPEMGAPTYPRKYSNVIAFPAAVCCQFPRLKKVVSTAAWRSCGGWGRGAKGREGQSVRQEKQRVLYPSYTLAGKVAPKKKPKNPLRYGLPSTMEGRNDRLLWGCSRRR